MLHPNVVVNAMREVGHELEDLLPAYPGKTLEEVDQLLRDNALALERPVIPYGLLGILPCQSRYFNVSEHGFRIHGEKQPWPPRREDRAIFFFGGSTAAGFNLEDNCTVPAYLQQALNTKGQTHTVYNFGSGNYTLRRELLRFLELIDREIIPERAVFLDGFNDSYYAFGDTQLVSLLSNLYLKEKSRRRQGYFRSIVTYMKDAWEARHSTLPSSRSYLAENMIPGLEKYLSDESIVQMLSGSNELQENVEVSKLSKECANIVWERYLDSVELIRTICKRKGIECSFIWQPVPLYKTSPAQRVIERTFLAHRYANLSYFVYRGLEELQIFGKMADFGVINCSVLPNYPQGKLYVDNCHYSAVFAEALAGLMANRIGLI